MCEAYPSELAAARAGGVPVVVSRGAALAGEAVVDPYDDADVTAQLAQALRVPRLTPAPVDESAASSALAGRLRALIDRRGRALSLAEVEAAASCAV